MDHEVRADFDSRNVALTSRPPMSTGSAQTEKSDHIEEITPRGQCFKNSTK